MIRILKTKPWSPATQRTKSKLLAKLKADKRVYAVNGRREGYEDWFIELNAGWRDSDDPYDTVHCFGANTLTEAMKRLRKAIACDCDQCQREKQDHL